MSEQKTTVAIFAGYKTNMMRNRIIPALEGEGWEVRVIVVDGLQLDPQALHELAHELASYSVVVKHMGIPAYLETLLLPQVQAAGTPVINASRVTTPFIEEKSYQIYHARARGIRTPATIIDPHATYESVSQRLGSPFVIKKSRGRGGKQVFLAHDVTIFTDLFTNANSEIKTNYFFQEYIPHTYEYRVHAVSGRFPSLYAKRTGSDFRSNIKWGGVECPVPEEQKEVLFSATEQFLKGLAVDICAVDFMHSTRDDQLYFTEINFYPAWDEHDAEVTGIDMTGELIQLIQSAASRKV